MTGTDVLFRFGADVSAIRDATQSIQHSVAETAKTMKKSWTEQIASLTVAMHGLRRAAGVVGGALAEALGCGERTVSRMLIEPGNPGKTANGSYKIEPWRTFYAAHKERVAREAKERSGGSGAVGFSLSSASSDEKAALREAILRERRAKAELAELNAAQRRGELIALSEAKKSAYEFASRLRMLHHRAATVEAVNEISALLLLSSSQTADLLRYMEGFHERFCREAAADGGKNNGQ